MTDDQLTTAVDEATTPAEEAPVADAVTETTPAEAPVTDAAVDPTPEAEVAPVEAAPVAETSSEAPKAEDSSMSDAELFEAALADFGVGAAGEPTSTVRRGDRVEAEVILVEQDRAFVNLGTKADGVLPLSELGDGNDARNIVKVGDKFEVIVVKAPGVEGSAIVSKRKADFDLMWQRILDAFETKESFEANVIDRVKGGLVVDIGVRGFVPATHVGNGKLRNLEKFLGQTIHVKVIEVDKERKKVVLSNRAAEEENRESVKGELFSRVKVGDVVEGTVRRLTDFGAFIDLGGLDGLLHISEMSWVRIDHPREVMKVGDALTVKVLRLDEGTGRVSLGLRQVLPDPWIVIRDNYRVGQKINVTVGRIVQSGAFIKLPEGVEAFLPVSEMSDQRLKKPEDALKVGDEIEPLIIDLRPDDRRMVLSLRKNATFGSGVDYRVPGEGGGRPMRGGRGGRGGRPMGDPAPTAARVPTGGATIGERLGALKGLLGNRPADAEAPADAPAEAPAEEPKSE